MEKDVTAAKLLNRSVFLIQYNLKLNIYSVYIQMYMYNYSYFYEIKYLQHYSFSQLLKH